MIYDFFAETHNKVELINYTGIIEFINLTFKIIF